MTSMNFVCHQSQPCRMIILKIEKNINALFYETNSPKLKVSERMSCKQSKFCLPFSANSFHTFRFCDLFGQIKKKHNGKPLHDRERLVRQSLKNISRASLDVSGCPSLGIFWVFGGLWGSLGVFGDLWGFDLLKVRLFSSHAR